MTKNNDIFVSFCCMSFFQKLDKTVKQAGAELCQAQDKLCWDRLGYISTNWLSGGGLLFWAPQKFYPKKFLPQKILTPKNFDPKKFWPQKILSQKNVDP